MSYKTFLEKISTKELHTLRSSDVDDNEEELKDENEDSDEKQNMSDDLSKNKAAEI